MNLDTYMDDFGRGLKTARPRRPRRLLVAIPAAAALTAVGVIALPRGDGIDAIAEARQALAPKDEIVHMIVTFKPQASGVAKGEPQIIMPTTEQWYSAGQDRWRTRTELLGSGAGAARKFPPMEQIYVGDSVRLYDQRHDRVTIFRGLNLKGTVLAGPGPGTAGGDPATELRKQLDAGDLRDDGVVTHDGKQVRRLVREQKQGKRIKQRFVYYMDPQTFAPLGGRMYFTFNEKRTFMNEFTISGYERIPLNAESAKLLRFEKTPDTTYVWRDIPRRKGKVTPAVRIG